MYSQPLMRIVVADEKANLYVFGIAKNFVKIDQMADCHLGSKVNKFIVQEALTDDQNVVHAATMNGNLYSLV